MSLAQKRIDLVQEITLLDNQRYGCLTNQFFTTAISSNFHIFPNDFLQALKDSIIEFTDYHPDVMMDDPTWGTLYKEFTMVYQQCLYNLQVATYQYQQQQMALYAQQQQYQQQMYQQQQTQQQQFSQSQQQQGSTYQPRQYQQNYQQGQQGYQQQGQQGYQPRQNNYQNKQNNYNQQSNYQQIPTGQQNPNYQPRHNQNRQQGGQQRTNYVHQPNRQHNQQSFSGEHHQGEYHQGQHRGYNQHGGYHQHKGHYNNHHQQPYEAETQPVAEPVKEEPKVVLPPPPPPKPEPKPTKYSLSEIREFIAHWSDKDKELVNKDLIEKVNEVNGWTKGETSFEEKADNPRQDGGRKQYDNKRQPRDNRDNKDNQQSIATGARYNKAPQAPPELQRKDTGLKIVVGKNQTLEAKMIKKEIKERAGQDFATLMEKENETLDKHAIAKKEIIYNLNLLAPENLKDIQKDLTGYLFEEEAICKILIEQIIFKAWGQPKYASTYAKLCSEFSKIAPEKFHFHIGKKEKKENPFKVVLISIVQHSFDKKVETIPDFQNQEEKQKYLGETKKKILGNVKFIAELIRSKVLKKKIMKICISQLIYTFLAKYYYFRKTAKIIDSYYDYYFEALIEFIENVGEFYEKMDQATEKKEQKTLPFEPARRIVIDLIEMNDRPPEDEIGQISNLKANEYFELFKIIDERILRKNNTRLSALLLNLTERRGNKWQKHHAESDGPKKLKDIKQDIAKEEEQMNKVKIQKRQNMEHLHDLVKAMFKDWENGEKTENTHFKTILKEYKEVEFLTACLNQVADEKKEHVRKRLDLFDVILDKYFNLENIKTAWFECIKFMAFNSGDFPFAGAALAIFLNKILNKGNAKLKDFYLKTEDEDEEFFINQVFGRLYHYTKNEEIKNFTEPSKKYGNVIDI